MKKRYNKVTKRLTKKDVITIPNLLSFVRLALIPFIVFFYYNNKYVLSTVLLAVSVITDIADGKIARKYNMISDLGKFLDPVADKLTQAAMLVCLISKYKLFYILLSIMAIKEISMLVIGSVVLKKTDVMNSSKWYGKACTVILDGTCMFLFLFPHISNVTAYVLAAVCGTMIIYTFIRYTLFFTSQLKKKTSESVKFDVNMSDADKIESNNAKIY